jgi:sugar phosphate isomerase/epimerase
MAFSVALQLYSVRDYAERDLKSSLQKIREIGYDGVELAGLYGHTPAEVKEIWRKIGLTPISAHVPLEEMLAEPTQSLLVMLKLDAAT